MAHGIKVKKMVKLYQGFKGPSTLSAIIDQIPEVFFKELTSKQRHINLIVNMLF